LPRFSNRTLYAKVSSAHLSAKLQLTKTGKFTGSIPKTQFPGLGGRLAARRILGGNRQKKRHFPVARPVASMPRIGGHFDGLGGLQEMVRRLEGYYEVQG
jgi:hypothetical protein